MATGLGVIAVANTSTYIQAGLDTYIHDNGGSKTVECFLYFRRTNSYSGATYSSSVDCEVYIDSASHMANMAITVEGGKQNVWQGPFLSVSKTFTGGQTTATVRWVTRDNVGSYLGGSGSATITVPASYTPPTGLYRSNTVVNPRSITATIGVTGWGTGGSTAQHYVELSVCQSNNINTRNYKPLFIGDSLSGSITVDNSSPYRALTITPNQRYYLTQYASNGAAGTGNTSFGVAITPCEAPVINALTPYEGEETGTGTKYAGVHVEYTVDTGAGFLTTVTAYRIRNITAGGSWSQWWTMPEGYSEMWLYPLAYDSDYEIEMKVQQEMGTDSAVTTGTFRTVKQYKLYGSVNNQTKKITKLYGSVNGQTKLISKLYGSVNGVTKRIY